MNGNISWRDKAAYQSERMFKNILSFFLSLGVLFVLMGLGLRATGKKIASCFKRRPSVPAASSDRIVELREPLLQEKETELTVFVPVVDNEESSPTASIASSSSSSDTSALSSPETIEDKTELAVSSTRSMLLACPPAVVVSEKFSDSPLPPAPYEIPIPTRRKKELVPHPDSFMFNAFSRFLRDDGSFAGLEQFVKQYSGEAVRRVVCPSIAYLKTVASLTILGMVYFALIKKENTFLPREAALLPFYSIPGGCNFLLTALFTPENVSNAAIDPFEGAAGVAEFI